MRRTCKTTSIAFSRALALLVIPRPNASLHQGEESLSHFGNLHETSQLTPLLLPTSTIVGSFPQNVTNSINRYLNSRRRFLFDITLDIMHGVMRVCCHKHLSLLNQDKQEMYKRVGRAWVKNNLLDPREARNEQGCVPFQLPYLKGMPFLPPKKV